MAMADDVTGPYRYSLGDLPMEPPDNFGTPHPSGYPNRLGVVPLGAPQGLPAGFGMRLPGRLPPGPLPMLGQPTQPIRMPEIPEWLATLMAALPKGPRRNGRGRRKGNNETCYQEYERDAAECRRRQREGEYAHGDWFNACLTNAADRQADCIRNGGTSSDIPVWSLAHEEIYKNPDR
jgi:hypothetical protein